MAQSHLILSLIEMVRYRLVKEIVEGITRVQHVAVTVINQVKTRTLDKILEILMIEISLINSKTVKGVIMIVLMLSVNIESLKGSKHRESGIRSLLEG